MSACICYTKLDQLCCIQVNQEELKGLLPRQGFRRDGKLFALSAETAKHADAQGYGAFLQQLQGHSVTKFAEIFRANAKNNVNLRAAGNAMLVLNKIKTVRLLSQLVKPLVCLASIQQHWFLLNHEELSSNGTIVNVPKGIYILQKVFWCAPFSMCDGAMPHAVLNIMYLLDKEMNRRTNFV
jgi:hypothetical protein